MGFNSAFKGLNSSNFSSSFSIVALPFKKKKFYRVSETLVEFVVCVFS